MEFVARILGDSPKLTSIGLAISMTNLIVQNLWLHTKNISTSLRVCSSTICTKFNVQIGGGRHFKEFGLRAVRRSENLGVPVLFGGHNLPPLFDIGLTDLPKFGVPMAPPAPSGMTTGLSLKCGFHKKSFIRNATL
jgi:hypothetical protein